MTGARMLFVAAAAAFGAVALPGCGSLSIGSFEAPGADFARARTYAWDPAAGSRATGDPRLDNSPFFHEHLRAAIESNLEMRGLREAETAPPDLLLHYHATVTQRIDLVEADRRDTHLRGNTPDVYDAGTLVIDFVDARSAQLVWRGWAEGSIEGVIEDQDWMEERLDDAVTRIIAKLPRAF